MGELKIDNNNIISIEDYNNRFEVVENNNKRVSKIGISNITECLYNDEEIMLVYKEFKRRYDEAKTFAKKYQAMRSLTMFVCSIQIGLRGGDFCALTWEDIFDKDWNFKYRTDFVPSKTSHLANPKHIRLIWNNDFEKALISYKNWLEVHNILFGLEDCMFMSQRGKAIRRDTWGKIVEEVCKSVGIKQRIGTHGLRKTMAHQFIMKSEDKSQAIMELCIMFRHSSLEVTRAYSCLVLEELRKHKQRMNLFSE